MKKKAFKAESKRLLDLMINSIYTHKEIFLREIISNASDAIDKLCYLSLTDDKVGLTRDQFEIKLSIDKERRLLTVSDNGIGMTKEELEKNLALRVEPGLSADSFIVYGRGVLHLSVLIETMRREGYELQVGQPKVIIKEIDGRKCEPVEELTIDLPDEYSGKAIEMTTKRKGTLVNMVSENGRTRLEFDIPSRGIIGLRSNLLTATAGEAVMAHRFKDFEPYKGEIEMRSNGSLIAMETGQAYAYAINKLQDRGRFFVSPGDEIYCGQVVGESTREGDITINLTKSKKLTNMRASGSDEKMNIAPAVIFSLEEALEYIKEDEYVEVTPKAMRLRKILLDETERKRAGNNSPGGRMHRWGRCDRCGPSVVSVALRHPERFGSTGCPWMFLRCA